MALVTNQRSDTSTDNHNQMITRPLMLKEFLKFDIGIGSSSSSGFRSFPRQQRRDDHCCNISVSNRHHRAPLFRSRSISATASNAILKIQRTSIAILRAVSRGGNVRESTTKKKYLLLPEMRRSLSRKVWKSRWWRSGEKECLRRGSEREMTTVPTENGVVEELSVVTVGEIIGVTIAGGSAVYIDDGDDGGDDDVKCKDTCGDDQNKEQFSPVSVLDFHDDFDEGTSSPFTCTLAAHFEGSKHNLVRKLSRLNCVSSLKPVNLENRIAQRLAEEESSSFSKQPCTSPAHDKNDSLNEEVKQAYQIEPREKHLVNLIKGKVPSSKYSQFKPDNVLIDFFKSSVNESTEAFSLKAAEDWLNGSYNDLFSGWEVKLKRQAYIRDMEKGRRWTSDAEREEIAMELAAQVFASLSDELLLEISCC